MPPDKTNPSVGKYLAPALALLIAGALVIFVILNRQRRHSEISDRDSQRSLPSANPSAQLPPTAQASDAPALVAELVRAWETADVPEQRDTLLTELDALLQTADLASLVRNLPPDILDFALGLPTFQTWLVANPETALALFATRNATVSEARVRPALVAWLEKNPVACSQHLRALPAGPWREQTLALAAQHALATDPANAASWATLLAPGPRQTGVLEEIASTWSAQNPAKAAAWISSLPDTPLRERLHATHALAFAESDPAHAAAWLLQTVRPSELRDQTMNRLASIWAAADPALISAWLDRLPDSEARQSALRTVLNAWTQHDRPAAQAWIGKLPPGPARDEAQSHLDSLPALTSAH